MSWNAPGGYVCAWTEQHPKPCATLQNEPSSVWFLQRGGKKIFCRSFRTQSVFSPEVAQSSAVQSGSRTNLRLRRTASDGVSEWPDRRREENQVTCFRENIWEASRGWEEGLQKVLTWPELKYAQKKEKRKKGSASENPEINTFVCKRENFATRSLECKTIAQARAKVFFCLVTTVKRTKKKLSRKILKVEIYFHWSVRDFHKAKLEAKFTFFWQTPRYHHVLSLYGKYEATATRQLA